MDRKFTLYITDKDRREIDKLRELLTPHILQSPSRDEYVNKHGHLSTAALFRYLRHQELEKLGLNDLRIR